jgi:hypothetical protein
MNQDIVEGNMITTSLDGAQNRTKKICMSIATGALLHIIGTDVGRKMISHKILHKNGWISINIELII